jgi:ABC-2 type transport system permease protein
MGLVNIIQLGLKELRGLARNPMLIVLIAYAFMLAIYTASKAMPETLNRAPIAIVDED